MSMVAAIKIAQKEAHLTDGEYRQLLFRVAGVTSSKRLGDDDAKVILKEIKSLVKYPGWKPSQCMKWRQYVKFCGMDAAEAGQMIYKATGVMSEASPHLKQAAFDDAMAVIESELERRIEAGKAVLPRGVQIDYWRRRKPEAGMVNSRELKLIDDLWRDLMAVLPSEKQNERYFMGMASKACHSYISRLEDLRQWQALRLIEALKSRRQAIGGEVVAEELDLSDSVPF